MTTTEQPWFEARTTLVAALLSNAANDQLKKSTQKDNDEIQFASQFYEFVARNCQAPDTPMDRDAVFKGVCDTADEFIAWSSIDPLYQNWPFFCKFVKQCAVRDRESLTRRGRLFEAYWHEGDIQSLKKHARDCGLSKVTFVTRIVLRAKSEENPGTEGPLLYDSDISAESQHDAVDDFIEKRFAMETGQVLHIYYKDGRRQIIHVQDYFVDGNGRRDYPQVFVGSYRSTNTLKRNHKFATHTAFAITRKGAQLFLGDMYWMMKIVWERCTEIDEALHSISALESIHQAAQDMTYRYTDTVIPKYSEDKDIPIVYTDALKGYEWIAEKIAWFMENNCPLDIKVNRDDPAIRSLTRDIMDRISTEVKLGR